MDFEWGGLKNGGIIGADPPPRKHRRRLLFCHFPVPKPVLCRRVFTLCESARCEP